MRRPTRDDDALDDLAEVVVGQEARVGRVEPAVALDVDAVGRVDHDLGDGRVGEVALDRRRSRARRR